MSSVFDIRLFGDKALQRSLDRLATGLQRKFMRKSLRLAAKVVGDNWRSRVPVATGRYRANIKVRAAKRRSGKIGFNALLPDRSKLGIPDKYKWYYPAILEWGGVTKTGRVIPAGGYGRKALETTRQAAINAAAAELWNQIRAEATKKSA